MLSLEAAFDRIGMALRQMGYKATDETPSDASAGNRCAVYTIPTMAVRVCSYGRARLLTIQVQAEGEWIDFAKRGIGAEGIEESAVEKLVHAVSNEVNETSTDAG
jgi:hypothetical protein